MREKTCTRTCAPHSLLVCVPAHAGYSRRAASAQHLLGTLVHVFVWMFSPKESEDRQGPRGRAEIFDLNTYFHVLVLSEGAPVTCGKACFLAHLKVIDTLCNKVRNTARGKKKAFFLFRPCRTNCRACAGKIASSNLYHKQVHGLLRPE